MRKLIITVCLALAILGASAQSKTQQTKAAKATTEVQVPKGKEIKPGKATNHTYKGYPVYQGAKGGYYVIRTSKKSGKEYKQYIKPEKFDK